VNAIEALSTTTEGPHVIELSVGFRTDLPARRLHNPIAEAHGEFVLEL
jgi:hypothetical protein